MSIELIQTKTDFVEKVFESDKPVVVDFFADWCGPCRAFAPTFERLATTYGDRVSFVKVDTERAPDVAKAANVRSLPTVAFFWKGDLADVAIGAQSEAEMVRRLDRLVSRAEGKGLLSRLFGG